MLSCRALADAYDLRWNYVFNEEEEEGGVNEASMSCLLYRSCTEYIYYPSF